MTQTTTTTPRRVFRDRREAGRVLARLLDAYRGKPDVVVLGLPRGGIPVAWEVAAALGAPLDAFIVRKLGAPEHDELAVGAMALGGRVVINDDVVRALRVTPEQLREVAEHEGRELVRRESEYRGGRPPVEPLIFAVGCCPTPAPSLSKFLSPVRSASMNNGDDPLVTQGQLGRDVLVP